MNDEFAIGAVGVGRIHFLNNPSAPDLPHEYVERKIKEISASITERYARYRGQRGPSVLERQEGALVDDGIATGSTMRIAIRIIRNQEPGQDNRRCARGGPDSVSTLRMEADEVVCLETPEPFFAIGQFYESFPQVEDEEAIEILKRCRGK